MLAVTRRKAAMFVHAVAFSSSLAKIIVHRMRQTPNKTITEAIYKANTHTVAHGYLHAAMRASPERFDDFKCFSVPWPRNPRQSSQLP